MTLVKLLGGAVFTGMLGGAVHLQLADLHLPNHVLESLKQGTTIIWA